MCLSQRTLNILANASPYNSCHSRSPRFPRPPPHAGARHNPPPYLSVKPCSGANVVDAWPLYDHSGRQGWWLLPASGKTGVDVTGKSIDIVNKGRSKAVPSCASYIQADAGCGQSGPVLSSASGADTKWVFTPVNASAPNGRFLYYITMSVSAAAGGGGAAGGLAGLRNPSRLPHPAHPNAPYAGQEGCQLPCQSHRHVSDKLHQEADGAGRRQQRDLDAGMAGKLWSFELLLLFAVCSPPGKPFEVMACPCSWSPKSPTPPPLLASASVGLACSPR